MDKNQEKNIEMKWLFKIFTLYPWNNIGFTIIRVISFAGLGILPGIIVSKFFYYIENDGITNNILLYIFCALIIIPVSQAIFYYADMALSYGWVELIRGIFRKNILKYTIREQGNFKESVQHGQMINSLRNDINTPISLMWDIPYFLSYFVFSLVGIVILSRINLKITVILFLPIILVILVVNFMKKKIESLFVQQQKSVDNVISLLSDIFSCINTIKNNNAEDNFLRKLEELNAKRKISEIRNDTFNTILNSTYNNILNIGTGILLILISSTIKDGTFSIGDFSLFIYFLGYVSNLSRVLGNSLAGLKRTKVSYMRIKEIIPQNTLEILAKKTEVLADNFSNDFEVRNDDLEKIEVKGLTYKYPDSTKGIDEISFSIEKGSFNVVNGKMGSGKSTLLKVMLGLLPKDRGEIIWNDMVIKDQGQFFVPFNSAYIPQEPHLFSDTVKNNILLGIDISEERLEQVIKLAVLEEDIKTFNEGLDTYIGVGGVKLSGGQKQRLVAARMFVRDSRLWVFDDISSALDVKTEKKLWNRVYNYTKENNITCLIVSNKKYAMEYADSVITLDEGNIKK